MSFKSKVKEALGKVAEAVTKETLEGALARWDAAAAEASDAMSRLRAEQASNDFDRAIGAEGAEKRAGQIEVELAEAEKRFESARRAARTLRQRLNNIPPDTDHEQERLEKVRDRANQLGNKVRELDHVSAYYRNLVTETLGMANDLKVLADIQKGGSTYMNFLERLPGMCALASSIKDRRNLISTGMQTEEALKVASILPPVDLIVAEASRS